MDPSPPDDGVDYRWLVEHLENVGIWMTSEPGEFAYVSPGIEDIFGVPPETFEDDATELFDRIHPEDRDRIRARMEQPPEEITEETYENRVVRPDGTVRWVQTRQIPIRDDDGDLLRIVGINTDVTDLKRREQELAVLNRIVRHDIRNDMGIVLGWAELLESHVDEQGAKRLENVLATADHVVELTEIAADYAETIAGRGAMEVHPVSLRAALERELDLRREAFPDAEIRPPPEIPDVEVRANELLTSVFRNLINNAVQHNDADEPVVDVGAELDDGDAVVRVADNGPGIPAEVRETLFEEGEKGLESAGSGLGLYLVQRLVDQFGGEVSVTDNDPRGTVISVRLPLAGDRAEP